MNLSINIVIFKLVKYRQLEYNNILLAAYLTVILFKNR